MFTHDAIKEMYSIEGYLPNYPPHLISDEEMFNAFIPLQYFHMNENYDMVTFDLDDWEQYEADTTPSYFKDNYPLLGSHLVTSYKSLISEIVYYIKNHLSQIDYQIPSWVYSYMLGSTIGVNSDKADIHDFLVSMMCDNIDDDYGEEAGLTCYKISSDYINGMKISDQLHRPPTMFGEPHVLKYLRLRSIVS